MLPTSINHDFFMADIDHVHYKKCKINCYPESKMTDKQIDIVNIHHRHIHSPRIYVRRPWLLESIIRECSFNVKI